MKRLAGQRSQPRILFLPSGVDAGLGHLSRSAALARRLSAVSNVNVFFAPSSTDSMPRFLAGLNTIARNPTGYRWDHVVIDLASRTERREAFRKFRNPNTGITIISDEEDRLPSELLVVPGPHAHFMNSRRLGAQRCLLGPEYGLTDAAFHPRAISRSPKSVLVMLGSFSDVTAIKRIATACAKVAEGTHIVTTKALSGLLDLDDRNLTCHVNSTPQEIAHLLASVDVAVTSAGVGSLEALAVGTPLCVLSLTPAHVTIAESYVDLGVARSLGLIAEADLATVSRHCRQLLDSEAARQEMRARALQLGVWKGADKVARIIEDLLAHGRLG